MTTERTAEEVRRELRAVEGRLAIFERLVTVLEGDQFLLGASILSDTLAAAIPELATMRLAGDRRAEQASAEATEVFVSLRDSMEKFAEKRGGISFALRRGLIPSLRNRKYALEQELAALQPPPEPEAEGLLERVVRAARSALLSGHPA